MKITRSRLARVRDGGILNSELTAIVNLPLPPLLVPVPSVPHPYLGIAERITNVIVGDPVAIDAWAERGGVSGRVAFRTQ